MMRRLFALGIMAFCVTGCGIELAQTAATTASLQATQAQELQAQTHKLTQELEKANALAQERAKVQAEP
jgi:hypothetical protein